MNTLEDEKTPDTQGRQSRVPLLLTAIVVLAAAAALGYGIHHGIVKRVMAARDLARSTTEAATPSV